MNDVDQPLSDAVGRPGPSPSVSTAGPGLKHQSGIMITCEPLTPHTSRSCGHLYPGGEGKGRLVMPPATPWSSQPAPARQCRSAQATG